MKTAQRSKVKKFFEVQQILVVVVWTSAFSIRILIEWRYTYAYVFVY